MMAKLIALYHPPADPAAFDQYYRATHAPLAHRIPKLRSYTISTAPPRVLAGQPVYLAAELTFDSMADLDAALESPEGQATAGDLANFAQAGVTLLVFDSEAV
jgi:uncharacterized protein (TIGR02118 family)